MYMGYEHGADVGKDQQTDGRPGLNQCDGATVLEEEEPVVEFQEPAAKRRRVEQKGREIIGMPVYDAWLLGTCRVWRSMHLCNAP